MTLVLRVGGVQDTINAFRDLPRAIRNRHMRIAMNAGAGVIRDAAVANAPKETGLLKKSLKIKVRVPDASFNTRHHGRPAYAVIGPARNVVGLTQTSKAGLKLTTVKRLQRKGFRGNLVQRRRPSRYAHLVEKGTRPHGIRAKNVGLLSSGTAIFGSSVKHPGTKAQSFLSRAVQSSGEAAKQKVIQKLKDGITDWARSRAVRAKVGRIKSVADFINARNLIGS
jgi:HK97 gp10 family phage protein